MNKDLDFNEDYIINSSYSELDKFFSHLKVFYDDIHHYSANIDVYTNFDMILLKIKYKKLRNALANHKLLIDYLCKKTKEKLPNIICYQNPVLPNNGYRRIKDISYEQEILDNNITIVTNYMYYGYVPGFLSTEQRVEHKITEYYFLWQKENDPNKLVIPTSLTISNDNFNKYNRWSNEQLNTYYFANILPKILQKSELNINIHNQYYNKMLIMTSSDLKDFIQIYIKDGELHDNHEFYNIIKLFNDDDNIYIFNNRFNSTLDKLNNIIKNNYMSNIWNVLSRVLLTIKVRQNLIKQSLHKKLSNISDKYKNKNKRFKWQNLCSKNGLNNLDMEELQELAIIEKIPYYLMMTKIELCSEFAKRFSNIIQGKKKIEPMCINTTSILGTTINEIPPEFFFSYTHNNRIYCDDIRDLHKHFEINGNKHPIDRSIMKQSVVNRINTWYDYLVNISNNMSDLDEKPVVISMISQLSSKMANLTSKMNYPKNPSLFINSNKEKFDEFLDVLNKESIINSSEKITIIGLEDLNRKKLVLIDMLMLKIMNDPQQISITGQLNPLSAIAINLSNIYNNIF